MVSKSTHLRALARGRQPVRFDPQPRVPPLVLLLAILVLFAVAILLFNVPAYVLSQSVAKLAGLVLLCLGAGALLFGCLMVFPGAILGRVQEKQIKIRTAENDIRAALLSAITGALLISTVYFTWQQLQAAREEQMTGRFKDAVELLGNDNLDVRIGGVYALQGLAEASDFNQRTIYTLLSEYVRRHAPITPTTEKSCQVPPAKREYELGIMKRCAPDVHTALVALGAAPRRLNDGEALRLDLTSADLQGALLGNANLSGSDLRGAHLDDLDGRTDDGNLKLEETDLRGAHLYRAHLERAILKGADLRNAGLQKACLEGADLSGAKLDGVILDGVSWGSSNGHETIWPDHFSPPPSGVGCAKPSEP